MRIIDAGVSTDFPDGGLAIGPGEALRVKIAGLTAVDGVVLAVRGIDRGENAPKHLEKAPGNGAGEPKKPLRAPTPEAELCLFVAEEDVARVRRLSGLAPVGSDLSLTKKRNSDNGGVKTGWQHIVSKVRRSAPALFFSAARALLRRRPRG